MSKQNKLPTPYPRMGAIYRMIALALDTKNINRDVDRLAREGDFDWQLFPKLAQELITEPLENFDTELAVVVKEGFGEFFGRYIDLISSVSVDGLSRKNVLPILCREFFAPLGAEILLFIKKKLNGPDFFKILKDEGGAVSLVLTWLDQQAGQPIEKVAYPETVNDSRNGREMVAKWRRGENLPNFTSIKLLSKEIQSRSDLSDILLRQIGRWLLIARVIDFLNKEAPEPIFQAMRHHVLAGMPNLNVGSALRMANDGAMPDDALDLLKQISLAFTKLSRTEEKSEGDDTHVLQSLQYCEKLTAKLDPQGNFRYRLDWMYGRWCVLSGKLTEALPYYEKAIQGASYRAGHQYKEIMHEALVVAGCLGKKVFLKQMKHSAIALGFFAKPTRNDVVEAWEIEQFSADFADVFPDVGRFVNWSQNGSGYSLVQRMKMVSLDEGERIIPDLVDVNKVLSFKFQDGTKRYQAQLQYFITFNQFDKFKQVLEHGADVDWLNASNASALLLAFQRASSDIGVALGSGDDRYIISLLEKTHKKETINSRTVKKRLTPLMCAIDRGNPDFINRLLEMGADVNLEAGPESYSSLRYAVSKIGETRIYSRGLGSLLHSVELEKGLPMTAEVNRRMGAIDADAFGRGRGFDYSPMRQHGFNHFSQAMLQSFDINKVYAMCAVLLKAGANPNQPQKWPVPGRTPLMLVTEYDDVHLFSEMLKYGGDPYQKDNFGDDCIQLARDFRSQKVMAFMQERGLI